MNTTLAIGLSGIGAAMRRLETSAHNIANVDVAGFRRQTADARTRTGGGVDVSVGRGESSGADLAADLVAQHEALYAFKANLRTVQTHDAMLGTLLDEMA